ncbi:ATP-dependent RNA helicase TDRD9 [Protopterus annectens]|uniref:ATP-dependent RNA helicase TDRD9 n=1 Tax=Protopterus annectens TaxID=7888 RepID=UPI001CFAA97E|nr:ATP-dependent RNA helicase TDRD9 [Protopterus annectens]
MIKSLTVEQIMDWFTIGKNVANVHLLSDTSSRKSTSKKLHNDNPTQQRVNEDENANFHKRNEGTEYVEEYRRLDEQEFLQAKFPETINRTGVVRRSQTKLDCTVRRQYDYPDLPIKKCREELISLIESNSVVIVHGATGSGKSTQLPQYILDYYNQQSEYCNIVVTQPRKIGASSIARWISKERAWPLGGIVGYQVGLAKVATSDTRLIYMTTGVLLQKLVSAKSLMEFTHIFIDEVHERTEDMDFLLLVVRKLLRTNSRFVKVILMSATINCKEFADYFAIPVLNKLNPAYIFEVEGSPYAIEEYYLDDLKQFDPSKILQSFYDEPHIRTETYNLAVSLIQEFDLLESREQRSLNKAEGMFSDRGSVLVFLPGLAEINYMHEAIKNMVNKRLQIYPLHSSVTLEEQNDIFVAPVPGYRKIILSTNIAESSVTVPDVKYVIDFCLTRTLICDEDTNYQSLRLTWASKTSCNQRKGRAGRVSKGYCYRLISKEFWARCIPEYPVPEMLRCPLGSTVLKVKLLDMGEPRALLATALSPPNAKEIERTIMLLKEVGAVSVHSATNDENVYDGELTFLGRVLAVLPVDLHLGKLIVLGHVFGCLEECLIIAAALSLKNFFAMPFRQHLDGYRNKIAYAGETLSDSIALVNAFKAWETSRERGEFRHPKDELDWGRSHYIQIKRIREVAELYEDLRNRVRQFNMHIHLSRPAMDQQYMYKQRFILQFVLAGAFYPNYFMFSRGDEEMASKELCCKDPKTTVVLKNIPPFGFLYHKQLQSLFRQCGQVREISFDGARAYVEFSRNPVERSKILPAVYMSLKLAQLKVPFEINVHSAEEIEAKTGREKVAGLRNTRVVVDFSKQTIDPVGISGGILESSVLPSSLYLCINVTEVVDVGHFWGYRIDSKSSLILRNLATEINLQQLESLTGSPYPDQICLAPFSDSGENKYYRAKVIYFSGDVAEVFFVDYGNTASVNINLLRTIPPHLLDLPFQALEFQICKMRPSAMSQVCGDEWCLGARQKFMSLVNGCSLYVKIYSIIHDVLRVDVWKQTPRGDVNIRDVLILDGYAEPAEESYESKNSNDVLESVFRNPKQQKPSPKMISASVKEEEKKVIQSLVDNISANKLGLPKSKVLLHGPFNPYEGKLHSMTSISRFRTVWMERESVNSIVINVIPEDTQQRILIAASVSVNASGSSLLLRETTFMPNISGLPALICMVFAPAIELRTNSARTRYTGVLCGLGWNPASHSPVLAEHDIELPFDVVMEVDDILQINILRVAINKLICEGQECLVNLGTERIAHLQEDARQKLLDLVSPPRPRTTISQVWYDKPYQWNQVEPSYLVSQSCQEEELGEKNVLYELHKLILLNP